MIIKEKLQSSRNKKLRSTIFSIFIVMILVQLNACVYQSVKNDITVYKLFPGWFRILFLIMSLLISIFVIIILVSKEKDKGTKKYFAIVLVIVWLITPLANSVTLSQDSITIKGGWWYPGTHIPFYSIKNYRVFTESYQHSRKKYWTHTDYLIIYLTNGEEYKFTSYGHVLTYFSGILFDDAFIQVVGLLKKKGIKEKEIDKKAISTKKKKNYIKFRDQSGKREEL